MACIRRAFAIFTAVLFLPLAASAAPPQILGLVATATPTPLTCEDGTCWAEFSAFCLEQQREAPLPETAYRAGPGTALSLRITRRDGTTRVLDAASQVTVTSARIFTSVRIAVPESVVRAAGGTRAALSVGPLASLVPAATHDPKAPAKDITAAEIALYTGPLRATAEHFSDPGSPARVIAETALKLVNDNPDAPYNSRIDADAVWQRAVGPLPGPDASGAIKTVAREFRQCGRDYDGDGYMVNQCMRELHDVNMVGTNRDVWKGLGAGS